MVVWPHDVGEEKLNNEANSLSSLGTNEVLIYQCFVLSWQAALLIKPNLVAGSSALLLVPAFKGWPLVCIYFFHIVIIVHGNLSIHESEDDDWRGMLISTKVVLKIQKYGSVYNIFKRFFN
jgi:hypothetical protein